MRHNNICACNRKYRKSIWSRLLFTSIGISRKCQYAKLKRFSIKGGKVTLYAVGDKSDFRSQITLNYLIIAPGWSRFVAKIDQSVAWTDVKSDDFYCETLKVFIQILSKKNGRIILVANCKLLIRQTRWCYRCVQIRPFLSDDICWYNSVWLWLLTTICQLSTRKQVTLEVQTASWQSSS